MGNNYRVEDELMIITEWKGWTITTEWVKIIVV